MRLYRQIYDKIKKYNKIVIARHIGPDPDALGSQMALKESIQQKFPKKQVYAVGTPASAFKYIGTLDKFEESMYKDSLLIVIDTPDKKRIDGVDSSKFEYSIKIDHHPFVESVCDIELIDDTSCSAAQLVLELINNTPLIMNTAIAEKIFIGIIADTNRFLFTYTTPKTFSLVANLITKTNLNFTEIYDKLYLKPVKETRFQGYIADNMVVTPHGLGYLVIDSETMKKYNVDAGTAGNMVNDFNYIKEVFAWVIFSEDVANGNIRGSIRSRGPIVNETAARHNGGGHKYASGVRLKNLEEVEILIKELDDVCREYNEKNTQN